MRSAQTVTMKKIKAKAKVLLTLEVDISGWGEDCSIGQLYDQAGSDAISKVKRILEIAQERNSVRLVGEPKVTGVITEQE